MELKHSFLTKTAIIKLRGSGITSVKSFLDANLSLLTTLTALNETYVSIIKNYFRTMYEQYIPISLLEHQETLQKNFEENHIFKIKIPGIDARIKGITMGSIVEIVGTSETGKSKLCTTIALNFLVMHGRECYWIDTKMDFSPIAMEREMREKFKSNGLMINAMKKIHVQRKFSLEGVIEALEYLIENESIKGGLLILDSLSAIMCECVGQRFKFGERGLQKLANHIRYLCVRKHFTAVVTVLPKPDKSNPNKRMVGRTFNCIPNGRWTGTVNSIFKNFSSECFFITREELDKQQQQNVFIKNSNKRQLFLTKSFLEKNVLSKEPIPITITNEGVV